MACKGIELAIGQIWVTKDGCRLTIKEHTEESNYPWEGTYENEGYESYTDNGTVWCSSESTKDLKDILFNPHVPDGKYTVEEVLDGAVQVGLWQWDGDGPEEKTATYKSIEDKIKEKQDPEYAKYLELKAKFEK